MGMIYPQLDDRLIDFIARQPMFFVATAPCLDSAGGHVNVSPKGYRDTFAVLDPRSVAYLDLTGSGAETIAHLRQNGRITIMFCSFDRTPKILRIYGSGHAVFPEDPGWPALARRFPDAAGSDGPVRAELGNQRAIIVVSIERIADSCGYAVPVMEFSHERDLLTRWSQNRTPDGLVAYRAERNSVSIDGLPAVPDHDRGRSSMAAEDRPRS